MTQENKNEKTTTTTKNTANAIFYQVYKAVLDQYKYYAKEADQCDPHSAEYIANEIKALYYKGKMDGLKDFLYELKKQRSAKASND